MFIISLLIAPISTGLEIDLLSLILLLILLSASSAAFLTLSSIDLFSRVASKEPLANNSATESTELSTSVLLSCA